jgi:hypothetical protein
MNPDSGYSAGGATAVPAVLDPANAQHVWAVCSAIQGSTQSTSNEVGSAAQAVPRSLKVTICPT